MSQPRPARPMPKIRFTPRTIILLALAALVLLFISGVVSPIELFDIVLLRPMLNFLVLLSHYLFSSFGLAIIILTVIVRLLTLPLTMRQLQSTRAMQQIQPKMREVQKKYAKDKQRLNEEMFKLYKEHNVNPLGCAFPMLVQFPIWIALYQAVIQGLGNSPENLIGLSKQLYSFAPVQETVPLNPNFLGLDLGSGSLIMAVLVAASMWVLQKMSTTPSLDPTQQQTSRMMQWLMPLLFGFFAISFPSGLSLYWILSNLMSIVIQYRITGWGTLRVPSFEFLRRRKAEPASLPASSPAGIDLSPGRGNPSTKESAESSGTEKLVEGEDTQRKKVRHGRRRDKRKVRRRSR